MSATLRPPYVPPLRPRLAGTIGGRPWVLDDQYGSTGLAVGTGDRTHLGGLIPDMRVVYPDWPEQYKTLGVASTDHGSGDTGGFLVVGNVDRDPGAFLDLATVRASIATATGLTALATFANPFVVHPSAADKGEFFAAWVSPFDGRIYVAGHSASTGGSNYAQSQWLGRINTDFSGIEHLGTMGFRAGHNDTAHGGYVQPSLYRGQLVGTQLRTQAPGSEAQLIRAYSDRYWQPEPAPICLRDLAIFGEENNGKELARHGPIVELDGSPWQLAAIRNVVTVGGATNANTVALAPLSEDLRRVVGMPLLIAGLGGTGDDDEVSAGNSSPTICPRSDGSLAIYRTGEDDDDNRTPLVTVLRPATLADRLDPATTTRELVPAVTVSSNFDTLPNLFGADGRLQAPAASDPFAIFPRLDFAGLESPPDEINFVDRANSNAAHTPTLRSLTTDRGGLSLSTSTNQDLFAQFGPEIAVDQIALLSVTLHDVRFTGGAQIRFQCGFAEEISSTGYAMEFAEQSSIDNRARLYHYDGTTTPDHAEMPHVAPFVSGQTNRRKRFDRLTFSLVRYYSQLGTAKWVMIAQRYDQPIGVCRVATIGEYDVRPFFRLTGYDSAATEVTIGAVEAHAAWRQTDSGD